MTEATKIEWADSTFNPWEGCTKVGPGCDHCYAENRNARFGGGTAPNWGPGAPRRRTSAANWQLPVKWNRESFGECCECHWRGVPKKEGGTHGWCPSCRGMVQPARRRVFCASLADVFDNEVDPAWRRDLFHLIRGTRHLDWLLVTKRIGNVAAMVEEALAGPPTPANWPFPPAPPERLPRNVWLLITVCNQQEADRDIPKLLAIDAAVRGLSMEPLLGAVDLTHLRYASGAALPEPLRVNDDRCSLNVLTGRSTWPSQHYVSPMVKMRTHVIEGEVATTSGENRRIDWVIAGGESGPGARPAHPGWFRSLRDQCAAAGVAYLFKQWGEWAPGSNWPDDVAIPSGERCDFGDATLDDAGSVWRVGKKAAGRVLDAQTHNGYPEVNHG